MASGGSHVTSGGAELLQCPLCQLNYNDASHEAKILSCHHSLCLQCLETLAIDSQQEIKCPLCRTKTQVPQQGVQGLQKNFYVYQAKGMKMPLQPSGENCEKHGKQPLLFFCETCLVPICMNCTVLDHDKSNGHVIKDIAAALEMHKEILAAKSLKAERSINEHQEVLASLKRELKLLEYVKTAALGQIEGCFNKLRASVDEREEVLIEKVEEAYEARKADIYSAAQQCKEQATQLRATVEKCTMLSEGDNAVALVRATNDKAIMAQLDSSGPLMDIKNSHYGLIEFSETKTTNEAMHIIKAVGGVSAHRPLPANFDTKTTTLISSMRGVIEITVSDVNKQPIDGLTLSADISDACGDHARTAIQNKKGGSYLLYILPQMPGKHTLSIKFQGHNIEGTETILRVEHNNPVMKLGLTGDEITQLNKPTSLKVSPTGDTYVADMGNKRIVMYNSVGQYKTHFKVGAGKATTYDIAINMATNELACSKVVPSEDGVMMADSFRIFSLAGAKRRQVVSKDMQTALFITITSKGWYVLTDASLHCVFIFSKEGALIRRFGNHGNKPGQFDFPSAVCVDSADNIYVSDTRNHRIQVFTTDGKLLWQLGRQGKGKGQFYLPRGIAVDKYNHLLVADSHNRIQVFREAAFVSCVDSSGDPISEPYNMDVTQDGHVYLADFKNNCIKKYRYM